MRVVAASALTARARVTRCPGCSPSLLTSSHRRRQPRGRAPATARSLVAAGYRNQPATSHPRHRSRPPASGSRHRHDRNRTGPGPEGQAGTLPRKKPSTQEAPGIADLLPPARTHEPRLDRRARPAGSPAPSAPRPGADRRGEHRAHARLPACGVVQRPGVPRDRLLVPQRVPQPGWEMPTRCMFSTRPGLRRPPGPGQTATATRARSHNDRRNGNSPARHPADPASLAPVRSHGARCLPRCACPQFMTWPRTHQAAQPTVTNGSTDAGTSVCTRRPVCLPCVHGPGTGP